MKSASLFVQALFAMLIEKDIPFVLLRNFEELPTIQGHDVDLAIHPRDENAYRQTLLSVAEREGWQVVRSECRYGFRKYYLFGQNATDRELLQIDALGPIQWHGYEWLSIEQILAKRVAYKDFYVPHAAHQLADLLLKELLGSGKVKPKYIDKIGLLLAEIDQAQAYRLFADAFGTSVAEDLVGYLYTFDWDGLAAYAPTLRTALARQQRRRHPVKAFEGRLSYLISAARVRMVRKSGLFVALIGPDGSGKTTISHRLAEQLNWTLFQDVHYYHNGFNLLPELKTMLCRRQIAVDATPEQVADSYGHIAPHSPLKAMGYVLYYTIGYMLGHLLVVKKRSRGQLLICDRYFHDYFIQNTFTRLPRWFLYLLLPLVPSPDILLFINNEAEIIWPRKKEIGVEEIQRQLNICRELLTQLPNMQTVDGTIDLESTVEQAKLLILALMRERELELVTARN